MTQANIEIRDLFQNQVKAAYDKEKETQKKLMEQYQLTLNEKERAYKLMMTQRDEARQEIKNLEYKLSQAQDRINMSSAASAKDEADKKTGRLHRLFEKRKGRMKMQLTYMMHL